MPTLDEELDALLADTGFRSGSGAKPSPLDADLDALLTQTGYEETGEEDPELREAARGFVTAMQTARLHETMLPGEATTKLLEVGRRDPARFARYVEEATREAPSGLPKGVVRTGRGAQRMMQAIGDLPVLAPEGGRPALSAEAIERMPAGAGTEWLKRLLAAQGAERERRDVLAAGLEAMARGEPAKGETWLGEAALGAAEMVPPILATALTRGRAGPIGFWFTQIAPARYREYRAEGRTHKQARTRALITALPEAWIEVALGAMGGGKAAQAFVKGKGGLLRRLAMNTLKEYPRELTEEGAQEFISRATDTLLSGIEGVDPTFSHAEGRERVFEAMQESAGPLMFLMGGQAGVAGGAQLIAQLPVSPSRKQLATAMDMSVNEMSKAAPETRARAGREATVEAAKRSQEKVDAERAATQPAPEAAEAPPAAPEATRPAEVMPEVGGRPGVAEIAAYEEERDAEWRELREHADSVAALRAYEGVRDELMEALGERRRPAPKAKKVLGIEARKLTKSEDVLLRDMLRSQAKGARVGYKAGVLETTATHQELVQYIEDNLPVEEGRHLIRAVKKAVKAKPTAKGAQVKAVVKFVNRLVEKLNRVYLERDVRKAQKALATADLDPTIKAEFGAIMADLSFTKHREATVERAQAVLKAAAADTEGNLAAQTGLLERAQRIVDSVSKQKVADLTNEQLHVLLRTMQMMATESQRKLAYKYGRQQMTRQQAREQAAADVTERAPSKGVAKERRGAGWRLLRRAHRHFQGIVRKVWGKGTAMYDKLVSEERANREVAARITNDSAKFVQQVLADQGIVGPELAKWSDYIRGWFNRSGAEKVSVEVPDAHYEGTKRRAKTLELTRAQLVNLLNLLGRASQRRWLLKKKHRGIHLEGETRPIWLSPNDIVAIEQSAAAAEVRPVAEALQGFMAQQHGEQVRAKFLARHGYEMPEELDYWHSERAVEEKKGEFKPKGQFALGGLENMGLLQPLEGGNAPFLIRDGFAVFYQHSQQVAQFVGWADWIDDARSMLFGGTGSPVATAIREGMDYGDEYVKAIEAKLKEIEGIESVAPGDIGGFVRGLTRNIIRGKLGLKPAIALSQVVSYLAALNAGVDIRILFDRRVLQGDDAATRAEIESASAWLAKRFRGKGHMGVVSPTEGGSGLAEFLGMPLGWRDKLGMSMIHAMDTRTILRLWRAAKLEGQMRGLEGDALLDYTRNRAVEIVDETQPTWDASTTTGIVTEAKKSPGLRLLAGIMFASQRSKNWNMIEDAIDDFAALPAEERTVQAYRATVGRILNATMVQAIALQVIRKGVKVGIGAAVTGVAIALLGGEEPPEEEWKAAEDAWRVVDRILGNYVGVGDVAALGLQAGRYAATRALGEDVTYYRRRGGGFDILAELGTATENAIDATTFAVTQQRYRARPRYKKWPPTTRRAARSLAEALASVSGLPTSGAWQVLDPGIRTLYPEHPSVTRARQRK